MQTPMQTRTTAFSQAPMLFFTTPPPVGVIDGLLVKAGDDDFMKVESNELFLAGVPLPVTVVTVLSDLSSVTGLRLGITQ